MQSWVVRPAPLVALVLSVTIGCGTTRMSDTSRTATEQLLISDAIDRAVSELDFRALAGRSVFVDASPLRGAVDQDYILSSVRQQILASGCILRDKREEADYIVEARAGAVGTDRNELLYGVPALQVPSYLPTSGLPSSIPEVPLIKRTRQRGVVKVALFAYNRETGRPVWQSGIQPAESTAQDTWVFGAGPFQRGTIYDGTRLAGERFSVPLVHPGTSHDGSAGVMPIADEAYFVEPLEEAETEELAADPPAPDSTESAAQPSPEPMAVEEPAESPSASPAQPLPALSQPATAVRPAEPASFSSGPGQTAPLPDSTSPLRQVDPSSRDVDLDDLRGHFSPYPRPAGSNPGFAVPVDPFGDGIRP